MTTTDRIVFIGGGTVMTVVLQQRQAFKHLEIARPVGVRRYSRVLVDRYLAGQSTARIGQGSRS